MARFYTQLNPSLREFIGDQKIFMVATAPTTGRINLSPKGMDTFRCLNNTTAAYLDLTGSGNETAAHLRENGRMTILFCSFSEKPLILRLSGQGHVIGQRDIRWPEFLNHFSSDQIPAGARQIMVLDIEQVQTSCGYAVPMYDFQGERETLRRWAEKKGTEGIQAYWEKHNRVSTDGLPTGILD